MSDTLDNGIYYPIIVPFDENEEVDHDTLTELLNFGIERGLHGVFALGSVGQGPAMCVNNGKRRLRPWLRSSTNASPSSHTSGRPTRKPRSTSPSTPNARVWT